MDCFYLFDFFTRIMILFPHLLRSGYRRTMIRRLLLLSWGYRERVCPGLRKEEVRNS